MKKFFLLMALCCMSVFSAKAAEDVMYTRFSQSTRTLTYYYGVKPSGSNYEKYDPGTGGLRFNEYAKKIDTVVIDASMLNVHPTSLRRMFYGGYINATDSLRLVNLKEIKGLENLQTDEAVTLEDMFYGCESLQSIDLSHFNTSKVKIFSGMFYACAALTSLDLSSFETSAATKMESMFGHCYSLTDLDLSNFNTENVTDMAGMFIRCDALETLDISSFNTGNVTDMGSMFKSCAVLKTLDISHFDFSKVTRVYGMFQYNHALETIYCNTDFNELTSLENSDVMFDGCSALVGGNGTTYDTSLPKDKTYARPDGGAEAPGYFTLKKEVYTVFDGETLTYYYDDNYIDREGIVEMYDIANTRFVGYNDQIKKAVIDESMKNANLTSTRMMFYGGDGGYYLPALTEIEGLQNLNTANVTDMSIMFGACQALEIVDISGFDFSSVTNASAMFMLCTALTTIYCNEDLNNYSALNNSLLMFHNCTSLVGGEGTEFDANHRDKTYARPDGGAEAPGYFTLKKEVYTVFDRSGTLTYYYDDRAAEREGIVEKYLVRKTQVRFDGYNELVKKAVIDESMKEADLNWMGDLFYGGNNTHALINMTDIEGLENLNTSNVSYMGGMFLNCSSLTTLDIRSFEFNFRPTGVTQMFSYCRNLETIYCNVDLTDMYEGNAEYMFLGCDKLKGGNGTRYDADHTNNSYARPDKPGQPGYFTELIDPCAVPTDVRLASEVRREDMIELAWTPGKEGQTGWGFRYKKSSERTYTEYYSRALNSGSSNPSMQIWGLEPGTEYDFVVFAICGDDILSNEDISDDSEPFTASTLMPEGVESIQTSEISGQKMLRDGQLFIESNGKLYNAQGAEVK